MYINTTIPDPAPPNGIIAGLWTDLNPGQGGLIVYGTDGTPPNRRFVVDYSNVPHYFNTGSYSFQIILNEFNQSITSTIVSVTNHGSDATRGVEDQTGTAGTQGSFNQPNSALPNSTWLYTPGQQLAGQAPQPGSAVMDINGALNAGGQPVSSNQPGPYFATVPPGTPLTMDFGGTPGMPLILFGGPLSVGFVHLPGIGQVDLDLGGLFIIANGAAPACFLDPFFVLDGSGRMTLSISTGSQGALPPLTINCQSLFVAPANPSQLAVSNAVSVTIH